MGDYHAFTTQELWAIHRSVFQPHLITGKHLAALRRAARKAENIARYQRRAAIHNKGRRDVKRDVYDATFEGEQLNSLETHTYEVGRQHHD